MVFAPVLGYIPQYNMIRESKQLGSFSVDVCAILLISNIIRIFFWFAHGYALALFLQSILMIIAQVSHNPMQLLVLRVCVQAINHSKEDIDADIKDIVTMEAAEGFSLFDFWRWSSYRHYSTTLDNAVMFLIGFTFSLGLLTWGFMRADEHYFGQILGFVSMSIEVLLDETKATLGFPQLYKNHTSKSVAGLSFILVLTWFLGDFFKTIYYILEMQPVQFIMCGTIQLTVDIMIILQIAAYKKNIEVSQVRSDERLGTA